MSIFARRAFLWGLASLPLAAATNQPGSMEWEVFEAINFQRVSEGSPVLDWNPMLCLTARSHSQRMLNASFFSHQDPQSGDLPARLTRAGVTWRRCGENIFREKDYSDPVAIAVVEWMYSPGHRRNLMNPDFASTGVGVAVSPDGFVAVTQQFVS